MDINFDAITKLLNRSDEFKINSLLYKIQGDALKDIISSLHSAKIPKQYLTYKELLREKIELKFQLKTKDTILFFDDMIYVKKFLQVESKDQQERRSCGIPAEVLQEYKAKYFKDDSHKEIIFRLLVSAMEDTLSYKRIDPLQFNKLFIPVFINIFEILLIENTDLNDEVSIKGFGLYLLREMFDEIMLYIAEDILFNFSNHDRKAIEFLSFFSVNDTIDAKGVRHKSKPILDESNNAWNITTIRSIMVQHIKAKQDLYDKKNALVAINKKLDSFSHSLMELTQKIKAKDLNYDEIDNKIENIKHTLRKTEESDSPTVKYVEDGVEKVLEKKLLTTKLFKKEDELLLEQHALKKEIDVLGLQVENKKKEVATWQKKYNEAKEALRLLETKGHPIDELYTRIKKALAKTLTMR
ncbi:MAG: hypothetical protein R3331_12120 [Sulfurospirillaceae bacterium]|nr:hypothetical protein [Sulfurospirillaceae bacterium]